MPKLWQSNYKNMTQNKIFLPDLPTRCDLDVGAIAAFFNNNDTSYKFLWMLSVLELMEKSDAPLPADKIIKRMLDMAKPLIKKYRLRFGRQDRMKSFLIEQAGAQGELSNYVRRELLSFAPYRLLKPFLKSGELRGLNKSAQHQCIRKHATLRFGGNNPMLYKFVGESKIEAIEIDPAWRAYLLENIAIVRGWVRWHWALFLESRNPNRPNIAKQILPEMNREPVAKQRRFWRQVMGLTPIKCLYSGGDLSVNNFVLDHYIPFNFIGHNQLWNLHPVASHPNLDKSNKLPHTRYFDGFIEQQQTAITVCRQGKISAEMKRFAVVEYSEGLNIDAADAADANKVKEAYQALILPLITIARSYGFSDSWEYANDDD